MGFCDFEDARAERHVAQRLGGCRCWCALDSRFCPNRLLDFVSINSGLRTGILTMRRGISPCRTWRIGREYPPGTRRIRLNVSRRRPMLRGAAGHSNRRLTIRDSRRRRKETVVQRGAAVMLYRYHHGRTKFCKGTAHASCIPQCLIIQSGFKVIAIDQLTSRPMSTPMLSVTSLPDVVMDLARCGDPCGHFSYTDKLPPSWWFAASPSLSLQGLYKILHPCNHALPRPAQV